MKSSFSKVQPLLIWSKEWRVAAIRVQQGQQPVNQEAETLKDKISMMVRGFEDISSRAHDVQSLLQHIQKL